MCGIAGFVHKNACTNSCIEIESISHSNQECRGPDNHSTWTESNDAFTVHLYHQRLRIQDLSSAADQPMHSRFENSSHLVFNGEIYNAAEISRLLIPDLTLQTRSDTEVLVETLALRGTEEFLNLARGMFAIGNYNSKSESLELIRDFFGEKPLHYSSGENFILFASQFDTIADSLKALGEKIEFDQDSIYKYLILGYFPFESSLIKKVKKLPPGTVLKFDLHNKSYFTSTLNRWRPAWNAYEKCDLEASVLKSTLKAAVAEQLVADVPLGVFLSGGVDSTLVSALAQSMSTVPIHSFSLGFDQLDFDESKFAAQAAQEIGTFHHALRMSADDAKNILPDVLRAFPEPLGDPSVFPTTFISREARKFVTVTLTGDGADELFFGYGRYGRFLELQSFKENHTFFATLLRKFCYLGTKILPIQSSRIKRVNSVLSKVDDMETYISLVGFGHYKSATNTELFDETLEKVKAEFRMQGDLRSPLKGLRQIDIGSYLAGDILVKVDRAAMAFGLETRAPFLDSRVAGLAANASAASLNGGEQKHALKELLASYVSADIFQRSKMGFGAPLGVWLRTTLNSWASNIIKNFEWESIGINSEYVDEIWIKNEKSSDTSATYLWILLSLASSVERFK